MFSDDTVKGNELPKNYLRITKKILKIYKCISWEMEEKEGMFDRKKVGEDCRKNEREREKCSFFVDLLAYIKKKLYLCRLVGN